MPKLINELGNTYGLLKVVGTRVVKGKTKWLCECSCGSGVEVVSSGSDLRGGDYTSCGCAKRLRITELGKANKITGESKSKEANILRQMLDRCYDKKSDNYPYYGGKGVVVCDRWKEKHDGLLNFIEDMGRVPDGMWIERISSDGDYCPENCMWDTISNQQFNRQRFVNNTSGVTGVTKSPSGWVANIQHLSKRTSKLFPNFSDAVAWRKEKELELFGEAKPEHRDNNNEK